MKPTAPPVPSYARDETARRIFSVLGIPPEELAYTMAAYSRSKRSFLETNTFITSQKAANFLETFYFAYGHRSIADMAHIPMALENISILAAIDVVAEQLWDGQERSTRYQDFAETGYCIPDEIAQSPLKEEFARTADALFAAYARVGERVLDYYLEHVEKPADLDEKAFQRTMKARAFDVARYLLPMATHTSVGQIVSARTMEQQISRLLSSPYGEVRRIGEAMKAANQAPARNPRDERLRAQLTDLLERLPAGADDELREAIRAIDDSIEPVPAAPTLVKYTAPLAYRPAAERLFHDVYAGLLGRVPVEDRPPVTLVQVDDPAVEAISKLLYTVGKHPFDQIVEHVSKLSVHERRELLELAFADRGKHDDWLREFRVGALNYDITMDVGSFRDLHRHRRCQQYTQGYTTELGFEVPEALAQAGCEEVYVEAATAALACADRINEKMAPLGAYVMPLGTRCRSLFSMDLAELAYIVEMRTRPTGHFSYRRIAYAMYQETVARFPDFAPYIRAVDPAYEDLTER